MSLKHAKTATLPDQPGVEINAAQWNADHIIDAGGITFNDASIQTTAFTNSSALSQLLTSYASTTGIISASDSLLIAIEKLNGNLANAASVIFGTGADGIVSVTTSISLSRDMHYTNLTISGSGKIYTNGWRIYIKGTLDISSAGAAAINAIPGTPGGASGASPGNGAGGGYIARTSINSGFAGAGGAGNINNGAAGNNGGSQACLAGGLGGKGGAGGAGGTGTGGNGGTAATVSQISNWNFNSLPLNPLFVSANAATPIQVFAAIQSGGGGGGGGDTINSGGGGSSSSNTAGSVCIFAQFINRSASTTIGAIAATANAPGPGADGVGGNSGGGGGGGGSGGGLVWITVGTLLGTTATNCIDVSGGPASNGGAGKGTGIGGTGGDGGSSGKINIINLSTNIFTSNTSNIAGTAGTAGSGVTAGTGGMGAIAKFDL